MPFGFKPGVQNLFSYEDGARKTKKKIISSILWNCTWSLLFKDNLLHIFHILSLCWAKFPFKHHKTISNWLLEWRQSCQCFFQQKLYSLSLTCFVGAFPTLLHPTQRKLSLPRQQPQPRSLNRTTLITLISHRSIWYRLNLITRN